ncbi:MAG: sugar phosphate isomerase/epimerase family protein [Acidobacteriota bacterium]
MRIGGCSFAFGPKPLAEAARILKGFGFQTVDLGACLGNTQVNPFEASGHPQETADTVNRCLDDLELERGECFVLDFGEPLNHPDPEVRRETQTRFKPLARFARLAGFRSVMLIPGIVHHSLGREKSYELAATELGVLCRIAEDEGVLLNIEPCEPSVIQDPGDVARMCEEVAGLGLTLDYSHFIDPGYRQSEVEVLHRYARHFHARQAAPGKRVETVAQGTIDFKRVVSLLEQARYEGIVAVEYVECETTRQCGVDVWQETPLMRAELVRLSFES